MRFQASTFRGERLNCVAFPMGGIGAGMICLEGTGALSHVSLRHRPEVFHEPMMFSALFIKGTTTARVLEGPVPSWKAFGNPENGNGRVRGHTAGLPRFAECSFEARFPFATVRLADPSMPVSVELTGWSPFVPGNADASSLPVLALEFRFKNLSSRPLEAVYSFHAANFMAIHTKQLGALVGAREGGFVLVQPPIPENPAAEGSLAAFVDDPAAVADCAWFRGNWFDPLTVLWQKVMEGGAGEKPPYAEGAPGNGGSLYVPFKLGPRAVRTLRLHLAWYVPHSTVDVGSAVPPGECGCSGGACKNPSTYAPWYAVRFSGVDEVAAYWRDQCEDLGEESARFRDGFHDSTLPSEVIEAVAANLAILKSPTCLRQSDGRFWGWEGCGESQGCCSGTCTHVWNYAQAVPHLFPSLERTMRETEFSVSQDARGHQNFRASLPIRTPAHDFHAAADGQLGGLMKLYREWRISGDTAWMKSLWPAAKQSLAYCIETWDPDHTGTLIEPHHNTYDIEFWGPDGLCTGFYLGALRAAIEMGKACGEDAAIYEELLKKGKRAMEVELWNGEYFIQRTRWQGLRAGDPVAVPGIHNSYSPEALAILQKEGPKYQYGNGCLVDGILGDWIARCCGLETGLAPSMVRGHLEAVFRHNFRATLEGHSNPQRPGYAFGKESGLLMCSWPHGDKPSLPFPYSDEVWTGCEYQAAAHLAMMGRVPQALRIVRAVRKRYDGRWRNPFDEYECGHWYARAMSSYGLLQALSGARYDAVEKTLHLDPSVKGDFRAFLCTAGGYGTVGLRRGKPFLEVCSGKIEVRHIEYAPR